MMFWLIKLSYPIERDVSLLHSLSTLLYRPIKCKVILYINEIPIENSLKYFVFCREFLNPNVTTETRIDQSYPTKSVWKTYGGHGINKSFEATEGVLKNLASLRRHGKLIYYMHIVLWFFKVEETLYFVM